MTRWDDNQICIKFHESGKKSCRFSGSKPSTPDKRWNAGDDDQLCIESFESGKKRYKDSHVKKSNEQKRKSCRVSGSKSPHQIRNLTSGMTTSYTSKQLGVGRRGARIHL